jgi:transposase InsO family protein
LHHPATRARPERASPRALGVQEQQAVLAELRSERFVDQAPAAVYAALLDEGRYLGSERTMYRLLAGAGELRERRDQLRHPAYAKPELLATRANEVWSWDITKLLGPAKWTYFYLYVILDICQPLRGGLDGGAPGVGIARQEADRRNLEKALDPARPTHRARRPGHFDDLQAGRNSRR